ncbi:MAG: xanthine dehydrogenase subunit XdhB [Eubacteriaceae bacterium]
MYDIKTIYCAKSVSDAISALEKDPGAMIISGGTDVLIQVREGKHAGVSLVSIHDIDEIKGITMTEDGTIIIGSGTTFSNVTNHPIIKEHLPVLGYAADQVGGPQIRNMGTIGGNVCNGVTSADTASTLCTLNAMMVLEGPTGLREVKIGDFYKGVGKTDRSHEEILTQIIITKDNYEGFGGNYIKYAQRNAMDIATLGCSVSVKLSSNKEVIEDVRIAYGVASPVPVRCPNAEKKITGMKITKEMFKALEDTILTDVNPRDSWRASKAFRIQLVKELSRRALTQGIINAGGEIHA